MILAFTPSAAAKITPLALLEARSIAPASNACQRLSEPVNRRAWGGAGEPDGVGGVALAVVLGEIGLGDDEPQRLLRRRAVAEPQDGRLRERRICCCQQEQAEDDYSTNAAARSAVLRASERFTHVVLPCGEQSRSCPPHFGR